MVPLLLVVLTLMGGGDAFHTPSSYYFRSSHSCPLICRQHYSSPTLFMGKGDGKKKRPKKQKNKPSSSDSASPPKPAAPRVSNQISMPVRKQIALVQRYKQQQNPSTSFRRTKYRRTEQDVQSTLANRGERDADWNVVLHGNITSAAPLVLVDGYNIIYAWKRLKKHMHKGDPERSRQLLLDDLEGLRTLKGWRIECVFDGARRTLPLGGQSSSVSNGVESHVTKSVSKYGVRVVYTGAGVEADAYIESRCAAAKDTTRGKLTGSLIVATDDSMIRLAGQSAGAMCMSAERFVTELKAVHKGISHRVEVAVEQQASSHNGRTPIRRGRNEETPFVFRNRVVIVDRAAERRKRKEEKQRIKTLLASNATLVKDDEHTDDFAFRRELERREVPNRTRWEHVTS